MISFRMWNLPRRALSARSNFPRGSLPTSWWTSWRSCYLSDSEEEVREISSLDQNGVYGWGHSDRGQLGLGPDTSLVKSIQYLEFSSVPHASAAFCHSRAQEDGSIFIIRQDGRNSFYGTGDGTSGVSGFQTDDPVYQPIAFETPQSESEIFSSLIVDVSCGRFHVNYLTGE